MGVSGSAVGGCSPLGVKGWKGEVMAAAADDDDDLDPLAERAAGGGEGGEEVALLPDKSGVLDAAPLETRIP